MIKTIIVDDEPLATGLVKEFLSSYPQFEVVAICHDGFEALKAIQLFQPDLIFLDIQMPKITGFELLELLDSPPAVLFTTAFDQYAVQAFDAKGLDYLVKPFSEVRFAQAIARFLSQHKVTETAELPAVVYYPVSEERSKRIVVRVKNEIKIIQIQEVRFFEAEDDYISIHTQEGKFLKKMTMKQLEESLDPEKFARVHRSFLVNLQEVSGLEPYEKESYLLRLRTGQKIPVSKSGYARLRQLLGL
ncbi:MAG: LytTR family transcriptional regulator DNA-binding domain-containing protein [Bacteroidetes bacterium]|nr:LytTR family transcriptional regulator DNA-binding domain-containing protein [Bacteroidota bacterium]MDA1268501.1 LytTR family transcriptional regulator DNA-binding domain-containing protein [Bacteroidota bacterium]